MSLPLCHLTTLSASISFVIALVPSLKDSITTTHRLATLTKSAILQCAALSSWADLVREKRGKGSGADDILDPRRYVTRLRRSCNEGSGYESLLYGVLTL
jgi:hypothetical protein